MIGCLILERFYNFGIRLSTSLKWICNARCRFFLNPNIVCISAVMLLGVSLNEDEFGVLTSNISVVLEAIRGSIKFGV